MCELACTKSETTYFQPTLIQVGQTEGRWIKVNPVNAIGDQIEFSIPGTTNEAIDMNNTSIYIRGKLTTSAGAVLGDNADVAPVNNFLHSLFNDVEVHVNGCLVNKKCSTYPYSSMLHKLTQVDVTQTNAGWLALEGFYPPKPGDPANAENDVFKTSAKITTKGREFELVGTPHVDLFYGAQALPPGCDLRLIFTLANPDFFLIDRVTGVKCVIMEAYLYVRKVTLSDTLLSSIKSVWQEQEIVLPFTRREVRHFNIPTGVSTHVEQNAFSGRLPVRLFICLVDNTAFVGSRTTSPFNFSDYKINKISVTVNDHPMGHSLDSLTLKDFNRSAMAYRFFLECIGAVGERALATPVSYEAFVNGSTIFAFSRAPDLCHGEHALPDQTGIVKIELGFSAATTNALSLVVMGEFDSSISIDKNNNVTTTYSV